jgi:anaerobic selenocysteine-containing dehydrogenase
MGMISWIINNKVYDASYLQNTNKAAADADGEPTRTDATYLVGTFTDSEGKQFQRYITAKEAGFSNGTSVLEDDYVVSVGDVLSGYNEIPHGDLEVTDTLDLNIGGVLTPIECKTAFSLLKEAANSMSRSQYASICGVSVTTMETLASEFVNHGKKAVAITYRGPIKHTNGLYNQWAIQHLNTLGGWDHKSGVVSLGKVDGDPGHAGIRIDRAKTFYNQGEAGSLFTGYPAKRPWFPFGTHGNYQEVIPSVQDQYPYGMKVLITYWNAWPYSTPGLRKVWEETVADETKLPLFVSISALIGEVAAWADYVLPDTTYLEKFAVPGVPWRVNKGTSFQEWPTPFRWMAPTNIRPLCPAPRRFWISTSVWPKRSAFPAWATTLFVTVLETRWEACITVGIGPRLSSRTSLKAREFRFKRFSPKAGCSIIPGMSTREIIFPTNTATSSAPSLTPLPEPGIR